MMIVIKESFLGYDLDGHWDVVSRAITFIYFGATTATNHVIQQEVGTQFPGADLVHIFLLFTATATTATFLQSSIAMITICIV